MNQTERAKQERLKRLYKRIYQLLASNQTCLFITFTFSNETLQKTNKQTRLRYIKAYLINQTNEYILNIDYGKTNKREHYHAIATPKTNYQINFKAYKYGQITALKINQLKRFTKNHKPINEIAKDLMIHATKGTTKGAKIIYSRQKRTNKDINIIENNNFYKNFFDID